MTVQPDPLSTPNPDTSRPSEPPRPSIRQGQSFWREIVETILLIVAIYAFVNLATARFVVDGHSMLPNFDTDQFIIVSRLSYLFDEPARGDVVVFHYPRQQERDFIKRIIGLPGETITIQNGRVYVNGERLEEPYIDRFCPGTRCDGTWEIGPDEYFVLGDNRGSSQDSQDFGPVERQYMVGRAFLRYWPPSDWAIISAPDYGHSGVPLPTVTPTPTLTPTPEGWSSPTPSSPYYYQ